MSERILIIEDEAAIQAVLYELLTSQGYEVVVSGDGLDGLTKFREQNFSLVLLDIMMPKIDGFTVCEAIRRESSTPVIMLTALDEEEAQIRAFERNADDYITKPFSLKLVLMRIEAVLRRCREAKASKDVLCHRNIRLDATGHAVWLGRGSGLPDPHRIQPVGVVPAQPRPGVHPRQPAQSGMGL